jgi:hypothetical protein
MTTKQEYLQASQGLTPGFGRTADFVDPQIGKTVQSEGGIPAIGDGRPGQTYAVDQLPDPGISLAYGIAPQSIPEHLIIDGDIKTASETDPQGPTTDDVSAAAQREALGHPVLDLTGAIATADEAMDTFNGLTGPNAVPTSTPTAKTAPKAKATPSTPV